MLPYQASYMLANVCTRCMHVMPHVVPRMPNHLRQSMAFNKAGRAQSITVKRAQIITVKKADSITVKRAESSPQLECETRHEAALHFLRNERRRRRRDCIRLPGGVGDCGCAAMDTPAALTAMPTAATAASAAAAGAAAAVGIATVTVIPTVVAAVAAANAAVAAVVVMAAVCRAGHQLRAAVTASCWSAATVRVAAPRCEGRKGVLECAPKPQQLTSHGALDRVDQGAEVTCSSIKEVRNGDVLSSRSTLKRILTTRDESLGRRLRPNVPTVPQVLAHYH
eukprot:366562-Chlamydomonas_euryale.AAC.3